MDKAEKHLIIRITEYALKHERFSLQELYDGLGITDNDTKDFIKNSIRSGTENTNNPNHIIAKSKQIRAIEEGTQIIKHSYLEYSLLPQAFYNYVDYTEIVEARKAATSARSSARWAIGISIAAMIASIVLGLWQIKLTNEANERPKLQPSTSIDL